MRKKIIFMFSGQGSHYYQMGKHLFDEEATFRQWMLAGNQFFYEKTNINLLDELYYKNYKLSDIFDRTLLTHPAIFLFEYALAQVLLKKGIMPDYAVGTSLGEFAAAAISGVISFEDALTAVIKQAQAFETYCPRGGMLAILGSSSVYQEEIKDFVDLAGINFANHFVVSSLLENVKIAEEYLKKKSIISQRLSVSHAFHSIYIDTAKDIYLDSIKNLTFKPAQIPWISGCKNNILSSIQPSYFWEVARLPILFQEIIQKFETIGNYVYLDLGPSGTLATFVKYNLSSHSLSKAFPLYTPFGSEIHKLDPIVAE